MHTHSSPIVSVDLIGTYGDMSSGPMHNQGLDQNVDVKKTEMGHKETFPKETEEDFILVTMDNKSLHSPPATEVLTSREETLATMQDILELLTHRVPCMRKRRKIPMLVHW